MTHSLERETNMSNSHSNTHRDTQTNKAQMREVLSCHCHNTTHCQPMTTLHSETDACYWSFVNIVNIADILTCEV